MIKIFAQTFHVLFLTTTRRMYRTEDILYSIHTSIVYVCIVCTASIATHYNHTYIHGGIEVFYSNVVSHNTISIHKTFTEQTAVVG